MSDPVITADGHTYERIAIAEWFRDHDTSPLTGAVLSHTDITPNLFVRNTMAKWMEINLKIIPRCAIDYSSQPIGAGSFKTVYRGTLTLPGAPAITVAVLELRAGSVVRAEVDIFLKLAQHPRLVRSRIGTRAKRWRQVRFFGQCEHADKQLLLTEFAPMGCACIQTAEG